MKKNGFFLIGFICVACLTGCDKLSFLGDYFPSLKEKSSQKESMGGATTPTVKTKSKMTKDTLVKVDNWTLTIGEFNEKLKNLKEVLPDFNENDLETKQLILEELIRQQLLVKNAQAKGISREKNVIAAMDEFKKTLLVRELASKLIGDINITDKEAKEFYNENEELFQEQTEWKIREIVVSNEEKAKEIAISLLQGGDFSQAARDYSISATASKGGDLGFVVQFEDPKVKNAVIMLEEGAVSNVFKGDKGYYIVMLEEKRGGTLRGFEEVKADLKEGLLSMKQQQTIVDYVEELRAKASIKINENLLK